MLFFNMLCVDVIYLVIPNPSGKSNPEHSLFPSWKHAKCRQSEVRHFKRVNDLFIQPSNHLPGEGMKEAKNLY